MNDNTYYIIITILKSTTCASEHNDFFCRVHNMYNVYNIRRRKIRLSRLTPTCVVPAVLYKRTTEYFRSAEIDFLLST